MIKPNSYLYWQIKRFKIPTSICRLTISSRDDLNNDYLVRFRASNSYVPEQFEASPDLIESPRSVN